MRIVAGKLRHRNFDMTNLETTRETQDRVREGIFNSIGPYFNGGISLDLFCGSASMSLEAYSRGIEYIYINDLNKRALNCAINNCKKLGISSYKAYNLDYVDFLKQNKLQFDYIFVDPPYKDVDILKTLTLFKEYCTVKKGTLIVFEMDSNTENILVDGYTFIKERKYGKKKVLFYLYE